MGISLSTSSTSVTISGAISTTNFIPASTSTVINFKHTGNGAVQTAYTVGAGKTFYLYGINIKEADGSMSLWKTDGTTQLGYYRGAASQSYNIFSATPIWAYAAGEFVKYTAANAIDVYFIGILN